MTPVRSNPLTRPQNLVTRIETLISEHISDMDKWGTETLHKQKEEELILFNSRKDHPAKSIYQRDADRIGRSYRKENPKKTSECKEETEKDCCQAE